MIPNETTLTPLSQSTTAVNTETEGTKSNVYTGVDEKLSLGATPMMSFGQAVSTCLIKKYATFKGRARRSELWWFELFRFIVCCVTVGPCCLVAAQHEGGYFFVFLLFLVWVALFVPAISVYVRRFHDIGYNGGAFLALWVGRCIPYVGIIAFIALLCYCCKDSNRGENTYGPSPKYPNS